MLAKGTPILPVTLYGIPNCDTVKKARSWLDGKGIAHSFHDYKKQGADAQRIAGWAEEAGWEKVLNRAGTTFRKLPEADKQDLDAAKAVAVMAAHPSAIKRPVVEYPGGLLVGFKEPEWEAAFA
jgi:Spx/MgsR family transcriptional regulator